MKKFLKTLLIPLFLLTLIPFKAQALDRIASEDISYNKSTCNLKMDERKLWIDHVSWTRSFIISDLASLPDKDPVLERLT